MFIINYLSMGIFTIYNYNFKVIGHPPDRVAKMIFLQVQQTVRCYCISHPKLNNNS